MAASLLQAVSEEWAVIGGMPTLWVGGIPEGQSNNLPNACLHHVGEKPAYHTDGPVAYVTGTFYFAIYATGLAAVEALAKLVMDAMEAANMTIGGVGVAVYRTNYVVNLDPQRDKVGQQVFAARIDYEAMEL